MVAGEKKGSPLGVEKEIGPSSNFVNNTTVEGVLGYPTPPGGDPIDAWGLSCGGPKWPILGGPEIWRGTSNSGLVDR